MNCNRGRFLFVVVLRLRLRLTLRYSEFSCHPEFKAPAKVRMPQCGNDICVFCFLLMSLVCFFALVRGFCFETHLGALLRSSAFDGSAFKIKATSMAVASASRPRAQPNAYCHIHWVECCAARPARIEDAVDFSRCIRSGDLSFWYFFFGWLPKKKYIQRKEAAKETKGYY